MMTAMCYLFFHRGHDILFVEGISLGQAYYGNS